MAELPLKHPTADELAVYSVCKRFLDGIKNRDPRTMHSLVLPNGHGTLIRPPLPGSTTPQVLQITLAQCVDRIPFDVPEDIEETIAKAEWERGVISGIADTTRQLGMGGKKTP